MKLNFSWYALVCSFLLFSKFSQATPVSIETGYQLVGSGYFSGSLNYVASSSTSAALTLVLTNLDTGSAGGNITAVALNLPAVSGVSFSSLTSTAPSNFNQLGSYVDNNGIKASPLGDFDFGAVVGSSGMGANNWNSGNQNQGIQANATGTFVFNFVGTNLNALSTLSFINAVAAGSAQSVSAPFIAIRFKGSGSDKVAGAATVAPPVPVPASVWLMLSGLGGLGLISRKRKANA